MLYLIVDVVNEDPSIRAPMIGNCRHTTASIAAVSSSHCPWTGPGTRVPGRGKSTRSSKGTNCRDRRLSSWKVQSVMRCSRPEHLTKFAATGDGSSEVSRAALANVVASIRPPKSNPSWRQTTCNQLGTDWARTLHACMRMYSSLAAHHLRSVGDGLGTDAACMRMHV